jgi:hypothetical protein
MTQMTTLLINGLSILMLLLFGSMAIFPLLLSNPRPSTTPAVKHDHSHDHEDVVLHISPAPMIEHPVPAARHQPVAFGNVTTGSDPSRRQAA